MDYISIDNFEGPLDLLLHLVKESNIDIFDIKVEEITDKYLDYINHEENLNINISSSYLVMAAELMYLKSKLLLPSNKKEEDNSEEDEEITRENLINKLLEYKKYKEMTPVFKELEEERKKIYIKAPEKVINYTESDYKQGILVLPIEQAKGLEFDSVIIMDLNKELYPDTELTWRLLYVGMTRALHRLVIFTGTSR